MRDPSPSRNTESTHRARTARSPARLSGNTALNTPPSSTEAAKTTAPRLQCPVPMTIADAATPSRHTVSAHQDSRCLFDAARRSLRRGRRVAPPVGASGVSRLMKDPRRAAQPCRRRWTAAWRGSSDRLRPGLAKPTRPCPTRQGRSLPGSSPPPTATHRRRRAQLLRGSCLHQ